MWRLSKTKIFSSKPRNIERILDDGKIIEGSKKCSQSINNYFYQKNLKIVNSIPICNIDPMKQYKQMITKPNKKIMFREINMHQMNNIITSLNPGNSFSNDYITSNIIKKLKLSVAPLLLNLSNNSIRLKNSKHVLNSPKFF